MDGLRRLRERYPISEMISTNHVKGISKKYNSLTRGGATP